MGMLDDLQLVTENNGCGKRSFVNAQCGILWWQIQLETW